MDSASIIESFINSFGKPEKVLAHLAENAIWTLHTGSQAPGGTYVGTEAISGLMQTVFGEIYDPSSCRTEIHQIIADANQAAVRFQLSATTTWNASYKTEYAIFVKIKDGKIFECHEMLDGLSANEQLMASAPEELKS